MTSYNFSAIGKVHSCYKEKFGIPRQPGLVDVAATIEIDAEYSQDEAFRELETFSHIWVIFVFHQLNNKSWNATVRPPRLGGNQRIGVFASRSMFRPNPVGLSVVKLESLERKNNKIVLHIRGADLLDATPVLDIKPYIPYADAIHDANPGYAAAKPGNTLEVSFTAEAKQEIKAAVQKHPQIAGVITQVLQLDPRPAYQEQKKSKDSYAIKIYDYDVKWCIENEKVIVTALSLIQ